MERIELRGAWPPAGEGEWIDKLSDAHHGDVAALAKVIESKKGAVLTQSVPNAQSADVLALYPFEDSNYIWELHQCKNGIKWPSPSQIISFPWCRPIQSNAREGQRTKKDKQTIIGQKIKERLTAIAN